MRRTKYFELLKNMGLLTLGNFSSKILVFLLIPVYTAALSTSDYGFYDLSYSTIQILFPILTLNIADGVLRFMMDDENDTRSIVIITKKYMLIGCLLALLISLVLVRINLIPVFNKFWVYVLMYYVFYSYNSMYLQIAKAMDRVDLIAVASIVSSAVLFVLTIVCLNVFKWGLAGFFVSNIFSQAVPTMIYFIKLHSHNASIWSGSGNNELEKRLLKYSLPLLVTSLCWWVNSSLDRYVVTFFCGVSISGILSVAYKIPNILSVMTGIFTQAWQISAIKESNTKESDENFYMNIFVYLNMFVCVSVAACICVTKFLANILFASAYYSAWKFVPFLLVSVIFNVGSGYLGPILNAEYNVEAVAKSGIYGMIINAVLNVLLTYIWGAQGVTIATVISSFIIYSIRKKAADNIFRNKKYKKMIVCWGMITLSAVAYTLFDNNIVPVVIFLLVMCVFFEDAKNLLKIVKHQLTKK